jgi:hypothetical protein
MLRSNKSSTADYSTDDMHWLCNWGGVPLLQWEQVGLRASDPCVISHTEYWINKEHTHLFISNARLANNLPSMNEAELAMMHCAMTEKLWLSAIWKRRHALAAAHERMQCERACKRQRVSFADRSEV